MKNDIKDKSMEATSSVLHWQRSVPIFKTNIILRQLGVAIGIPFGILALVIAISSGKSIYTLYALGLIAALLLLTWLFVLIVYRGKYEAEFKLDNKGVRCWTQVNQAKKNKIINSMTVVLGLLARKPAAAGAGMLAQAKQDVFIRWNHIQKVKYKPHSHTILLRGNIAEQIALFCNEDNYGEVESFVKTHLSKT